MLSTKAKQKPSRKGEIRLKIPPMILATWAGLLIPQAITRAKVISSISHLTFFRFNSKCNNS